MEDKNNDMLALYDKMINIHLRKVNRLQELFKQAYKYMIMIDKFYFNVSKSTFTLPLCFFYCFLGFFLFRNFVSLFIFCCCSIVFVLFW